MNYPAPLRLHDYRYLGDNYRQRELLKKKVQRGRERLKSLPLLEQQLLLHAMQSMAQECHQDKTDLVG